ncbi:hypothetical protein J437_LFUL019309, partial [Ladona fulva]
MPTTCVKCGDNHFSNDCTKPITTPAICANCRGSHPANYRGCSFYQKLKAKLKLLKEKARLKFNPNRTTFVNSKENFPSLNPPKSDLPSYAQAVVSPALDTPNTPLLAEDPVSIEIERIRREYESEFNAGSPTRANITNESNPDDWKLKWNANGIHHIALIAESHLTSDKSLDIAGYNIIRSDNTRAIGGVC